MWGRGQAGTLAALQDVEESLPFALLGLDSDNGGEFINHHVMRWRQQRARPVFMTRSRPYKKDDNAHVEQKNWTHIRQWFGYERHDNPAVVELINQLAKGPYGQLLNYFHASLKLESKERKDGRVRRIDGEAQTPLARVLASVQVSPGTKVRLRAEKGAARGGSRIGQGRRRRRLAGERSEQMIGLTLARGPAKATGTVALVRLRMSVHRRVEVPLWRCFPPRVKSNCVLATERGEQLETKG
jgi:hypothetical protein